MRISDHIAIMKDQAGGAGGRPTTSATHNGYVHQFHPGWTRLPCSRLPTSPEALTVVAEHADRGSRSVEDAAGTRTAIRVGQPCAAVPGVVSAESRCALGIGRAPGATGAGTATFTRQRCIHRGRTSPSASCLARVAGHALAMPVVQPDSRFGGAISRNHLAQRFLDRGHPAGARLHKPALASAQMH